jgi:hypothetical protein
MSKICFLIPDGVGIRNYLYSTVLKELHDLGHQIHIWHSLEEEVISLTESINGFRPYSHSLSSFSEDAVTQILRESVAFARLKHNVKLTGNQTLMSNWSFGNPGLKKKILIKTASWLGSSLKNYDSILAVESLLWKKLRNTYSYKYSQEKLKEIAPDFLFCTHQRMPGASAAMLAAKDMGIQTASAIFSWDNLPKARLAMRPQHYLVWSEYMKEELKFYYPELPQDSIQITGTPQFDFYSDPSLIQSREDFAAEFGLDPSKHWILFSGDDIKTSPYDADYLRDIANALKDEENLQILFRQVPVETTERYKSVLQTFPNIVHISPFWKRGEFWQQFFPYPKDLSHLVNLAFHCDTVINLGSTMALDFAFFDKPALYLNYDHTPGQTWTVKEIYGFQHFRSMDGLDPVGWISDPNTILSQVKKAIDFPQEVGKDRRKWLEKIVDLSTEKTASAKIAAFINQLVPNLQTK